MTERAKKQRPITLFIYGAGGAVLLALLAFLATTHSPAPAKYMGEATKAGIVQTQEPSRGFDRIDGEHRKTGPLEKESKRFAQPVKAV